MDTLVTVRNGIFFAGVFFASFAESSSSFFSDLSLLPAGVAAGDSACLAALVPWILGGDEAAQSPPQVPALQRLFLARLPGRRPPALLP
ncbi:MAG: hypothetical protein ACOYOU_17395 [Kiritimatiellia bacterium]|jgi:hypothetical protein